LQDVPRTPRGIPDYTVDLGGGWRVVYRVVPQDGRPVASELRVYHVGPPSKLPPGGIPTRSVLRKIKPEEHLYEYAQELEVRPRSLLQDLGFDPERVGLGPMRRGRHGGTDEHYALFAADYEDLVAGHVRDPIAVLATKHRIAEATARTRLATARDRGLLTSASAGRAGGTLTPKANRLLRRVIGRLEGIRAEAGIKTRGEVERGKK
jgi:hypothetical protein